MTHRTGVALTFGSRTLLAAAAVLVIALPIGLGVVRGQSGSDSISIAGDAGAAPDLPKYEVASIKPAASNNGMMYMRYLPGGTLIQGLQLQFLLRDGFGVQDDRIIGAPSWVKDRRFDIEAKVAPEDAAKLDKLKGIDRNRMLIPLLVERFNLKYHHESRELPMYTLVVAKGGPKLTEWKPNSNPVPLAAGDEKLPPGPPGKMMMGPGNFEAHGASTDMLAYSLSVPLGRTVVDQTGLKGMYDFKLQWTPDNAPPPMLGGPGGPGAPSHLDTTNDGPQVSLFTAIQEQLGLKLESQKGSVDVIVIDHIDPPSPN